MYAVIQTGGKQYRVAVGDRLKVESLVAEPGDSLELDKVLMISDHDNVQVGTPHLEGQSVSAQVVDHGRGEKIKVFKMQRRQGYRRTQGHRQNYTEIEITAIAGVGNATQDAENQQPVADTEAQLTEIQADSAEHDSATQQDTPRDPVESVTGDEQIADDKPESAESSNSDEAKQ